MRRSLLRLCRNLLAGLLRVLSGSLGMCLEIAGERFKVDLDIAQNLSFGGNDTKSGQLTRYECIRVAIKQTANDQLPCS